MHKINTDAISFTAKRIQDDYQQKHEEFIRELVVELSVKAVTTLAFVEERKESAESSMLDLEN